MKSDYTEFDKALLTHIAAGANKMMKLAHKQDLRAFAEPFRVRNRLGSLTPVFRVIDRRLQALRKKGIIQFNGGVWCRLK